MSAQNKASYGSRATDESGLSGKIFVIVVIAALLFGGFFVWNQWRNGSDATVSGTAAGFYDNTDDSIMMTLDITRDDASQPAYCIVTAKNYDKSEVGRREAVLAAGGNATGRLTVKIETSEQAVAADVYGCSTIFPSYLDDSTTTDDSSPTADSAAPED